MGWRLPSLHELASLYDVQGLGLQHSVFDLEPDVPLYWTATSVADDAFDTTHMSYEHAYVVGAWYTGGPMQIRKKSFEAGIWCVRGGSSNFRY